jgi:O-antigen/teichoic acid export membrane protein
MLKKRLALNLGANFFSQLQTVVSQLAVVPLFLCFWSKGAYGVWILVSAIPANLSVADAGLATQAGNVMSMAVASGDFEKARQSLHTAWGFLLAISIGLLLLVAITLFVLPWDHWLNFPGIVTPDLLWVLALLSSYTIMGICTGIFEPIYRTVYRNPRCVVLSTIGRLAELTVTGISVALSHSMICLASAMLATRFLTAVVMWIDSRRLSPNLHLGLSAFSLNEFKHAWRPASMFMAATLGNAFYFSGLTLLVGASLGRDAVVVFNITRTLTRSIAQFSNMVRLAVRTEFSYMFGGGDLVRARKLNELAFEVSICASLVIATGIFITAPFFLPFWTHHKVSVNSLLLVIFLTSAILNGVWNVISGLLIGINQHEGLSVRYLLAAGMTLGLAMVSVHAMGLYGVALAMVICELVLVPYAVTRTCHLLHQPVKEFLGDVFKLKAVRLAVADYQHRRLVSQHG